MPKLTRISLDVQIVTILAAAAAVAATTLLLRDQQIVLYGDAESHLNIAKRIVSSITPGLAQLGGIWLPLPHLLMLPFTAIDSLWRSGLAGSIVSGLSYVVSAVYLFKLMFFLTGRRLAGYIAVLVWLVNPNIVYLQSTAMTEIPFVALYLASSYYLLVYLQSRKLLNLLLAAGLTMLASLTRYDGWFLVIIQGIILVVHEFFVKAKRDTLYQSISRTQGILLMFLTLSLVGVGLWMLWNFLILGDPLYFTNSEFSAKSQQQGWLARGELPAYHNWYLSVQYYLVGAFDNIGHVVSLLASGGLLLYLFGPYRHKLATLLLLSLPFVFNIVTMYMGQSVMFLPTVSPESFEWRLFNARYGALAVPAAAIMIGMLANFRWKVMHSLPTYIVVSWIAVALTWQGIRFSQGTEPVISYQDAVVGLSSSPRHDAENWLRANYDEGLLLMDDYARTISVIRSGIPMNSVIYIGNKPYWEQALTEPESFVTWIILQESDAIGQALFRESWQQEKLYKFYTKTYESPEVTIFRRNSIQIASE